MSPRGAQVPARGGLLAAAAAFLLEPAPAAEAHARAVHSPPGVANPADLLAGPISPRRAPVVAVVGTGGGCGTTTVARALAAALATRDHGATTVLNGAAPRGSTGSRAARRMARVVGPLAAAPARALGRICLVAVDDPAGLVEAAGRLAPVVLDAGTAGAARGAVGLADHVVLVVPDLAEPALPTVVSRSLADLGPTPVCAVSRGDAGRWAEREVLLLPDSRSGARRARRGRVPSGELGRAIAALAERCGGDRR